MNLGPPRCRPLSLLVLTWIACSSKAANDDAAEGAYPPRTEAVAGVQTTTWSAPIEYHEILDPNSGMVQAVSPVPASWEVHPVGSPVSIPGPAGLEVHRKEASDFSWSPD